MSDLTEDEFTALSCAIGSISMQWAELELALDMIVGHIVNMEGKNESPPILYKRKIKFLRKKFKWVPALTPYRKDFVCLAHQAKRFSKKRNILSHSAAMLKMEQEGVVLIKKMSVKKKQHFLNIFQFDLKNQYPAMLDEVIDLAAQGIALADKILEIPAQSP